MSLCHELSVDLLCTLYEYSVLCTLYDMYYVLVLVVVVVLFWTGSESRNVKTVNTGQSDQSQSPVFARDHGHSTRTSCSRSIGTGCP